MDYARASNHTPRLRRELGLWTTTLIGVGIIIGAGIYALIGEGVALAGVNVWISFLLAAFVSVLTGLSYCELAALYPTAGAEFDYVKNALSNRLGFLAGFLIIVAGFISVATVALGFGGYFFALTGFSALHAAIGITILSTLVVGIGVKQSAWMGSFFTLIEAAGLLFIIWVGWPLIGSTPLVDATIPLADILAGGALVFFAFIGFEDIVRLSEETKNPVKTIPRAVILAILISSVLYVLVALSAVSLVDANQLAVSKSPLADVANAAAGPTAFGVLSIIALFSTGNTVLLFILVVSRIVYGMAKEGSLPSFLGRVQKSSGSPVFAVVLSGLFSLVFLSIGKIDFVANATAFILFLVFILVNFSMIRLRFSKPQLHRPFKVPFSIRKIPVLPVVGILASLVLVASMPLDVILAGIGFVVLGLVFERLRKNHRSEALVKN